MSLFNLCPCLFVTNFHYLESLVLDILEIISVSFFIAISTSTNLVPSIPGNFIWKSKTLIKVKAFAWLLVTKKVNILGLLQWWKPYEAFNSEWCAMCRGRGSLNHIFLHCLATLTLWCRLFQLAGIDWVSPKRVEEMLIMLFKGFGRLPQGMTLWCIANFTLILTIYWEKNAMIFEDRWRTLNAVWAASLLHCGLLPMKLLQVSLWASFF